MRRPLHFEKLQVFAINTLWLRHFKHWMNISIDGIKRKFFTTIPSKKEFTETNKTTTTTTFFKAVFPPPTLTTAPFFVFLQHNYLYLKINLLQCHLNCVID